MSDSGLGWTKGLGTREVVYALTSDLAKNSDVLLLIPLSWTM